MGNKRLYCAFVDLKRAFDSINRNCLWYKIYRLGLNGKLLRVIKDMYTKVKSCVRVNNSYSDFFDNYIGLMQGEIISPIMFAMFLEDLELFLQDPNHSGIQIDDLMLVILLFADDQIVFGDSPLDLQCKLNRLKEYCDSWGLEVNCTKTKTRRECL